MFLTDIFMISVCHDLLLLIMYVSHPNPALQVHSVDIFLKFFLPQY